MSVKKLVEYEGHRRVIMVANSTMLVSLPWAWCKSQGIRKGDELRVVTQGNMVVITKEERSDVIIA